MVPTPTQDEDSDGLPGTDPRIRGFSCVHGDRRFRPRTGSGCGFFSFQITRIYRQWLINGGDPFTTYDNGGPGSPSSAL